MLIVIVICAVLVFVLCLSLFVLYKKDITRFKLTFAWPLKLDVEFEKSVVQRRKKKSKC